MKEKNKKLKISNKVALAQKKYSAREAKVLCYVLSALMEEMKYDETEFWNNQEVNKYDYLMNPENLGLSTFKISFPMLTLRKSLGNISANNANKLFSEILDLQHKVFCVFKVPDGKIRSISVFPMIEADPKNREITFYVSAQIFSLYFDVINMFTLVNVAEVIRFSSNFSFPLYSYALSRMNSKIKYTADKPCVFYWTTKEAKEQFNLDKDAYCYIVPKTKEKKFSRNIFEKRTLNTAIDEINKYTNLSITYTKEKDDQGKISKYVFSVYPKEDIQKLEIKTKKISRSKSANSHSNIEQPSLATIPTEEFLFNDIPYDFAYAEE